MRCLHPLASNPSNVSFVPNKLCACAGSSAILGAKNGQMALLHGICQSLQEHSLSSKIPFLFHGPGRAACPACPVPSQNVRCFVPDHTAQETSRLQSSARCRAVDWDNGPGLMLYTSQVCPFPSLSPWPHMCFACTSNSFFSCCPRIRSTLPARPPTSGSPAKFELCFLAVQIRLLRRSD